MNRLSQIEFKQQELERNQAQVISLHNDLRKQMTNLNRNVQGMFADFLNQFGKETSGSSYNVLDRQIVLYTGDTSLEMKGPTENDVRVQGKKSKIEMKVQFEDDVKSRAKDVEAGKEDVDTDVDYILVDDGTLDIRRMRLRKEAVVFRSPYTSNFDLRKK
ncbi:hypothetical protein Adt_12364 [Abeliophyllum distichum]|uniref:Uncharacterized protein n=1 Tax=Abeliophyllum distichum TaxID=126358 RepID=A0ABD1UQI2_9LAMI